MVSLKQFWHINSKGAVNWINSDFVKVFENSVPFYQVKYLNREHFEIQYLLYFLISKQK